MNTSAALPYLGTFTHAFDEKGRLTVPREWRGEGFEERLVAVPADAGMGRMLRVFPGSFFAREFERLGDAPLDDPRRVKLNRLFAVGQMLQMDAQHRVALKEELRRWAGLEKTAVLVGAGDHFQMCEPSVHARADSGVPTVEQVMREVRG
jgi:MraZ protein